MSQKSRVRPLALLLCGLLCTAMAYAGPEPGVDSSHVSHWPQSWTTAQESFRISGNSYYVGVHGLSSVLVTSDQGRILLDGTLPESADKIADSIDPVSVADFKFTDNDNYPNAIQNLEGSFAPLSKLPCDILISAQPEFSGMWAKLARTTSEKNGFFVPRACRKYVGIFRESLRKRIAAEHG